MLEAVYLRSKEAFGLALIPPRRNSCVFETKKAPEGAKWKGWDTFLFRCKAANAYTSNWFIVLSSPDALSAPSPEKYSLCVSPKSEPAIAWCLTHARP